MMIVGSGKSSMGEKGVLSPQPARLGEKAPLSTYLGTINAKFIWKEPLVAVFVYWSGFTAEKA